MAGAFLLEIRKNDCNGKKKQWPKRPTMKSKKNKNKSIKADLTACFFVA
nr:MAG TPA: hypothetical protein [Caudoviricetes sp.]